MKNVNDFLDSCLRIRELIDQAQKECAQIKEQAVTIGECSVVEKIEFRSNVAIHKMKIETWLAMFSGYRIDTMLPQCRRDMERTFADLEEIKTRVL